MKLIHRLIVAITLLALLAIACSVSGRTPPRPAPPEPGRPTSTPAAAKAPAATKKPPDSPARPPASTSTVAAPAGMAAFHRSGQTFLTWPERADLTGELYNIYRSGAPIKAGNFAQASLIAQVGKFSARVWANYYVDNGKWAPRLTDRFIIVGGAPALADGVGALVWTLAAEDFGGQLSGLGYYAVTVTPAGGREIFTPGNTAGPVEESIADPLPVEISYSPGMEVGPGGHFYLQYMDLHHWNPTFHVPNATNLYYGFDPKDPSLAGALAYAYDYSIFEPTPDLCGGQVPDSLPVLVFLHGHRGNRYPTPKNYLYPYCAYGVYPVDQTQTWWFGFARGFDFRAGAAPGPGVVIENFTEQRVLRIIYDLMRDPPGPAVDPQRVYLFGHSMGGTGALAFAQRYPNVFAALYSGQPVIDFRPNPALNDDWSKDTAVKWGAPLANLPVALSAPNQWADHLQKYNGVGVYDWEDLSYAFDPEAPFDRSADPMAPFGIDHGTIDDTIIFPSQAQPLYPLLNASGRAWAGGISQSPHLWSVFGWPLPALATNGNVPFWGFGVIRDETVPGFAYLSSNTTSPPAGPTTYNQTVLWSASWDPWDGAPIDRPDLWQMSFCAVAEGSPECGSGRAQTVDITPRRLQRFAVSPGLVYAWENRRLSDGALIASGAVAASSNGLLTIPRVQVLPEGNRLVIKSK